MGDAAMKDLSKTPGGELLARTDPGMLRNPPGVLKRIAAGMFVYILGLVVIAAVTFLARVAAAVVSVVWAAPWGLW